MAQAVHDFRSVVDYLEFTGVDRIALTGLSLGGYTSALLAAVEPRLQAVIPNVPVVSVDSEIRDWFPANKVVQAGQLLGRVDHGAFTDATAYHSPLNYPPLVAKDRRIDHHRPGDWLAPPEQSGDALAALGSMCAALVPGEPRAACQPADLPAPDDRISARIHVLTPMT